MLKRGPSQHANGLFSPMTELLMLSRIVKWVVGSPTKSLAPKGKVGVLAIMKNETDVLREWIEHYRWQGIDKIFLIDNGSTDDPERILREHLDSGFIEFFSRPRPHRQAQHYREVFRTAGIRRKVEWLVIADLDEFWFSPSETSRGASKRSRSVSISCTPIGSCSEARGMWSSLPACAKVSCTDGMCSEGIPARNGSVELTQCGSCTGRPSIKCGELIPGGSFLTT